jgi:SAM-dependent methyltransferase
MKTITDAGYNDRLFSSGFRRYLHLARFLWLRQKLLELNCRSSRVIELGCFDGKVIEFLPNKPDYYVGYDADWEGGLSLARQKWQVNPNYHFRICTAVEQMDVGQDRFDIAISMETLEHIPEQILRPYLEKLATVTDRYIFITVPNEKGVVFFLKYLVKFLFGEAEKYSLSEFFNATLGRMDRVKRNEHKGFDYDWLTRVVDEYFNVVEVSGAPFSRLPVALNFTIGIIAKKRTE